MPPLLTHATVPPSHLAAGEGRADIDGPVAGEPRHDLAKRGHHKRQAGDLVHHVYGVDGRPAAALLVRAGRIGGGLGRRRAVHVDEDLVVAAVGHYVHHHRAGQRGVGRGGRGRRRRLGGHDRLGRRRRGRGERHGRIGGEQVAARVLRPRPEVDGGDEQVDHQVRHGVRVGPRRPGHMQRRALHAARLDQRRRHGCGRLTGRSNHNCRCYGKLVAKARRSLRCRAGLDRLATCDWHCDGVFY